VASFEERVVALDLKQSVKYGLVGLVTLLAGFGGFVVLNDAELDNAYYCTSKGTVGVFESLSATGVTGYWLEGGVKKQATCTKGFWVPLRQYCAENNIQNCGRLDAPAASSDNWTGRYWCTDVCSEIYR
jgi:hypothetical protein